MIYLASPYSDPDSKIMQLRYELVCKACAGLIKKDLTVYSPIAHWHPIAVMNELPRNASFWEKCNQEMIELCNYFWILMIDDWNISIGVLDEIKYANKIKKHIMYTTLSECIS